MALFGAIAAAVWLVVWWSVLHPPTVAPRGPLHVAGLPPVFRGWARWDAVWYHSIARDGYKYRAGQQCSIAFFPAYPLSIRMLTWLLPRQLHSEYVVGSLLTLASGFTAAALLWRWCRDRATSSATAVTAVALLAVYPYSIYLYGPVYSDAFFLAGILGAFVLLERDRVLAATLVAAVATAARPVGLLVAVALVLRLIERRTQQRTEQRAHAIASASASAGWAGDPTVSSTGVRRVHPSAVLRHFDPRALRRRDLVIFGSGSGYIAYCAYLWVTFGDPFLFVAAEAAPGWDQRPGPRTWLKHAFVSQVSQEPTGPGSLGLLLQVAFAAFALALIPAIGRRFGWAYAIYVGLVVLGPLLGSKDFQGMGRYLLPVFPVFALTAERLTARPWVRGLVFGIATPSVLLFASWFAKGNYLS